MASRRADTQPLLSYATSRTGAPVYRAIIDLFTEAAAGYASRLRPEDVHAALTPIFGLSEDDPDAPALTLAEVEQRLERLAEWGNLSRDYDSSRATTLDAYERTAFVYDLTPGGEAAHEALLTLEEGLRRVGGLQAVALRQIEEMLAELVDLFTADTPDPERLYGLCEDLHGRFKSLTGNATLFMQKVNRLLASPVVEASEFALIKADTIAYLNDFIADLDTLATHIRTRLDALDRTGSAARAAALAAGAAASGQLALGEDGSSRSWAQVTDAHLSGLADWFRAGTDARAGAAVLYAKARDAILGITRAVERIREASSSPSSRSADLLNLANRFAACASDEDAHALWHAAFGLASARHLGMPPVDDTLPASTSWWDPAGRADVPVRLRVSGRTDYVRRATVVPDHAAGKQLLALEAAENLRRTTEAGNVLIGLGVVRVSDLNDRLGGPINPVVLRQLAQLLSRAQKARPRADGIRRASSVDGILTIAVTEPRPPRAARLHATTGTWTLPDFTIHIEQHDRAAERARANADINATGLTILETWDTASDAIPAQVMPS